MTDPKRIQLSRARGWRLPEGAVNVARPTKWGNPFRVGMPYFVMDIMAYRRDTPLSQAEWHEMTPQDAVDCYRKWMSLQVGKSRYALLEEARQELRGHDLACWCPPGEPCHADVLLEIANA